MLNTFKLHLRSLSDSPRKTKEEHESFNTWPHGTSLSLPHFSCSHFLCRQKENKVGKRYRRLRARHMDYAICFVFLRSWIENFYLSPLFVLWRTGQGQGQALFLGLVSTFNCYQSEYISFSFSTVNLSLPETHPGPRPTFLHTATLFLFNYAFVSCTFVYLPQLLEYMDNGISK